MSIASLNANSKSNDIDGYVFSERINDTCDLKIPQKRNDKLGLISESHLFNTRASLEKNKIQPIPIESLAAGIGIPNNLQNVNIDNCIKDDILNFTERDRHSMQNHIEILIHENDTLVQKINHINHENIQLKHELQITSHDKEDINKYTALQEELQDLKSLNVKAEKDLKTCLEDLSEAIIENEKLNSEKRIDGIDLDSVNDANAELKRLLDQVTRKFENHIRQASSITEKEVDLIEKITKLEIELDEFKSKTEKTLEENIILRDENVELARISKSFEKKLFKMESQQIIQQQEFQKHQEVSAGFNLEIQKLLHENSELKKDILNLEEKLIHSKCQSKEKYDNDLSTLKMQFSIEKRNLVEEIAELENKYTELQMQSDRAIRDKRSAEHELEKLVHHSPSQIDQLEMTIDELNARLRSSDRDRIEGLHKIESVQQRLLRESNRLEFEKTQLSNKSLDSYHKFQKTCIELNNAMEINCKLMNDVSEFEKQIRALNDFKSKLIYKHDAEVQELISNHEKEIHDLKIQLQSVSESNERATREVRELLNDQRKIGERWKEESACAIKKYETSTELLKSQLKKTQEQMNQMQSSILGKKATIADLMDQIQFLKEQITKSAEKIKIMEKRNEGLCRQIASLVKKETEIVNDQREYERLAIEKSRLNRKSEEYRVYNPSVDKIDDAVENERMLKLQIERVKMRSGMKEWTEKVADEEFDKMNKLAIPDFLQRQAPANYVAGMGRGATGFTTRSDIGPAKDFIPDADETNEKEQFQDPDNETGLFDSLPYEADDEEADRIYEAIDKKMAERRKSRREAREKEELLRLRKETPTLQQQFADLKRNLNEMTDQDWADIPEVGDLTRKRGKKSKSASLGERFSAIPDSILLSSLKQTEYATALDSQQQILGGLATPSDSSSSLTDFVQFGKARDKVLGIKLDQVSDSVSGQTTIDPKGYLTDLGSVALKSDTEISDIKKARTLLKSVTITNPKHAPGWIAAARLEEFAGKHASARDIISKGCEECPKSEDVWLESARLNTNQNAKIILANAVRHVPDSVKIWLRAASLEHETDLRAKKRVLRRALEFIPNSVTLWKSAVSLEENPQDAKILLSRAVECVPLSIELWLALARLETYDAAKKVLNKARLTIPTSHEIWIAASKLEESKGNIKMVDTIISRAVSVLAQKGSHLDREAWIKEAQECEKDGAFETARIIINHTIGIGIDSEDRKSTWMDDAETCISQKFFQTARAIYEYSLKVFPEKKSIWRRYVNFEKENGTHDTLNAVLSRSVKECPHAEVLWLMYAKEIWMSGNISDAKSILEEAFASNPNSEEIWLAAIKLEIETSNFENARNLLSSARKKADTERVWMKSAILERQLGNVEKALEIVTEALVKYPLFPKLWMIKGQILENIDENQARSAFDKGIKLNPKSVPLWILASQLEEKSGASIKARALLEKARVMNPKIPELWMEAVRVETRSGNTAMAKALMAKSLQECPNSGLLWSESILMEPRAGRKSKSGDALKKCENDALVLMTIARLFWSERKLEKARNWFTRAIKTNPDLGDAYCWWLKFELLHGNENQRQEVIDKCISADPRHGEMWIKVSKGIEAKKTLEILKSISTLLENIL